jgi:hypothetical protein
MSTSSALASARRRRAGNVSSSLNDKQEENIIEQQQQPVRISPIQLLQFHEERIKKLEENLSKGINGDYEKENVGSYMDFEEINRAVDLKINSINFESINKDIELQLVKINSAIDELKQKYSKLDEFKTMLIKTQSDLYDNVKNINSFSQKLSIIENKLDKTDTINSIYRDLDSTGDNILEKLLNDDSNLINYSSKEIDISNDNLSDVSINYISINTNNLTDETNDFNTPIASKEVFEYNSNENSENNDNNENDENDEN